MTQNFANTLHDPAFHRDIHPLFGNEIRVGRLVTEVLGGNGRVPPGTIDELIVGNIGSKTPLFEPHIGVDGVEVMVAGVALDPQHANAGSLERVMHHHVKNGTGRAAGEKTLGARKQAHACERVFVLYLMNRCNVVEVDLYRSPGHSHSWREVRSRTA